MNSNYFIICLGGALIALGIIIPGLFPGIIFCAVGGALLGYGLAKETR